MISDLLWRCPLCENDDALVQRRRFLREPRIECQHCDTVWGVRRVVGDDYWMRVLASPANSDEVGVDLPLAEWYARMKGTLKLAKSAHPPVEIGYEHRRIQAFPLVPAGGPIVEAWHSELSYLSSGRVELIAEADDPLFFPEHGNSKQGERSVDSRLVGSGRLFLTNRRLIWRPEDGRGHDFLLERLNSVYATYNAALILLYGMRLYRLEFPNESILKWLTYLALVAEEVKAETGQLITTSNF